MVKHAFWVFEPLSNRPLKFKKKKKNSVARGNFRTSQTRDAGYFDNIILLWLLSTAGTRTSFTFRLSCVRSTLREDNLKRTFGYENSSKTSSSSRLQSFDWSTVVLRASQSSFGSFDSNETILPRVVDYDFFY